MKIVEDYIIYYDKILNKSILTFDEWEKIYIVFYENHDVLETLYLQGGEIDLLDSKIQIFNLLLEKKVICQDDKEFDLYCNRLSILKENENQNQKKHK